MSGFYSNGENFDRIFITDHQLIEQFVGTRLLAFGYNAVGSLGDNSTTSRLSPVYVSGGGNNWKQLSSGGGTSAGIKMDGTLWTWGAGTYGALGSNATASRSSPVTVSGGGTDWKEVSLSNFSGGLSSGRFGAGIKQDGKMFTWGYNASGQLGSGTTTSRVSPVSITGTISDWLHVACGSDHVIAVTSAGQLYTWGLNSSGQLGNNTTTNRSSPGLPAGFSLGWAKVSAGGSSSAAIKSDGTLWTWGINNFGILGNNSTAARSSPGSVAGGGSNWNKISMGSGSHCMATKTDGTLWTWGLNSSGELGTGNTTSRSSPGTVAGGGTDWGEISTGGNHSVAAKNTGTLWSWGGNAAGQLGNGTTTSRSSPSTVQGGVGEWQKVSASGAFTGGVTLASSLFIV